jgi:hypothetical protein
MSISKFTDDPDLGRDERLNLFIKHIESVNESIAKSERIEAQDFRKTNESHCDLFGFNEVQANWFTTNYRLVHGFQYPDASELLEIYMRWYGDHKLLRPHESRAAFIELFETQAFTGNENKGKDKALKERYPDTNFPNPLKKTRAPSVKDAVAALTHVPW